MMRWIANGVWRGNYNCRHCSIRRLETRFILSFIHMIRGYPITYLPNNNEFVLVTVHSPLGIAIHFNGYAREHERRHILCEQVPLYCVPLKNLEYLLADLPCDQRKQMMTSVFPRKEYKIHDFQTADSEVLAIFQKLADAVEPIMKKHSYWVDAMIDAKHNESFSGLFERTSDGQINIHLVSRFGNGDLKPFQALLRTLCHELAHFSWWDHDYRFQRCMDNLIGEVAETHWT